LGRVASGSGHRGNEAAAGDGGGAGAAEDETRAAAARAMHVDLKKGEEVREEGAGSLFLGGRVARLVPASLISRH